MLYSICFQMHGFVAPDQRPTPTSTEQTDNDKTGDLKGLIFVVTLMALFSIVLLALSVCVDPKYLNWSISPNTFSIY